MPKTTTKQAGDARDAKIAKLEGQVASLRHQVKELQARVQGETQHARMAWDRCRDQRIAVETLAEMLTDKARIAVARDSFDDIPF